MILSLIWFILHWDIVYFDFWVYSLPPVLAFKVKMQRSVKWSQQVWPGLSLHFRTEPAISMTLPGSPAPSDVITETQHQLMLPHTPLLFPNRKGLCHTWALKRRYQIIPKPSVCWSYKDKFPPSIRPVKNKDSDLCDKSHVDTSKSHRSKEKKKMSSSLEGSFLI